MSRLFFNLLDGLAYDFEAVKNATSIAMTALALPALRRWRLELDT
jgi:hypothetical protein